MDAVIFIKTKFHNMDTSHLSNCLTVHSILVYIIYDNYLSQQTPETLTGFLINFFPTHNYYFKTLTILDVSLRKFGNMDCEEEIPFFYPIAVNMFISIFTLIIFLQSKNKSVFFGQG